MIILTSKIIIVGKGRATIEEGSTHFGVWDF